MHHAHVLCAGESKYVVHLGVRRVVRARITLRVSARSLAVRSRRGCLGGRRTAALVAGRAVKRRGWKTHQLNLDLREWLVYALRKDKVEYGNCGV